jgi:hypothetical protein
MEVVVAHLHSSSGMRGGDVYDISEPITSAHISGHCDLLDVQAAWHDSHRGVSKILPS